MLHLLYPIGFAHLSICRILLLCSLAHWHWSLHFYSIPILCHLALLFPLVTGLLVSFSIWLFELSHRMMHFLSILCMVFAFFTTTLPQPEAELLVIPLGGDLW